MEFTAELVDDDLATVEPLLKKPLAAKGINLIVSEDPKSCLHRLRRGEEPADILLSDLDFGKNIELGIDLPYNYMEAANGATIATVLTNWYEKYYDDLLSQKKERGFSPALIADKSILFEEGGPEHYVQRLLQLLRADEFDEGLDREEQLGCYVLREVPGIGDTAHCSRNAFALKCVTSQLLEEGDGIFPVTLASAFVCGSLACLACHCSPLAFTFGAMGGYCATGHILASLKRKVDSINGSKSR